MTLLECVGVSKSFGGLIAVSEVSIRVEPAQIFGIIGPNGAGKTTLFNVVSGVDGPNSGRVIFNGTDITGWPLIRIARQGLIRTFQRSLPFTTLTVLENALVGAYAFADVSWRTIPQRWLGIAYNEAPLRDRAEELLDLAGLAHVAHVKSGELPYGDQRRLEIARALISRPKLLMLDEPAAGLSSAESATIVQLLSALRMNGQTVVIIEHNLPVIMGVCDQIAVLDHGVKIADASPSAVQTDAAVIEAYIGKRQRRHATRH